ncbi:hypothetical protein M5689_018503 [Euphorbia peplus]|nr:hypothetical protein M5689_018503 [Euphorbia peplus]
MSSSSALKTTTGAPAANYDVEFRAIPDDAWYSVRAIFDGEKLTVKYDNFTEEEDSVFRADDFSSAEELEEFRTRFRPLSIQLQDNECKSVAEGMVVCASCCFTDADVRFFDAFVDAVINRDHVFTNGEEQCTCEFAVVWKHGPVSGNMANRKIENICLPQSNFHIDPNVASFVKLVVKKLETADHEHIFSPQVNKGPTSTRFPVISKWKSQEMERMYNLSERTKEETDVGGGVNHCIVIDNLEKDLPPSTIVEFIHSQTSISVKASVFPSLPTETYTKGIIVLDCAKDLQKLCEFLDSSNHIIVSWRGRPWMTKKIPWNPTYAVSFGTLMAKNQVNMLGDKCIRMGRVKVVPSGSEEYEIAKHLRDMYMEFVEHQEMLHETLALEEKKILRR